MPGAIAETIGTPTRQPLSRQPNMKERHYDQYIRRQRNIQVTDGLKDINVMFSQTCWGSLPHPNLRPLSRYPNVRGPFQNSNRIEPINVIGTA